MIRLLEITAPDRQGAPPVAATRTASLLEWSRITAQVASFCLNRRAAAAVRRRRPFVAPEDIALRHDLADEMQALLHGDAPVPLVEVSGALGALERPAPFRLEGPDLVHVAAVAEDLDAFRGHLLARRDDCPSWGEAAVEATVFSGLTGAIRRALDPGGRILDGASPLLARLRRDAVAQERSVRQEVGAAMSRARGSGWTTGEEVTLRGDRFCIPLRSGDSARLPGIVHDRSATGATLFVEPAQVVSLTNALTETRLEIAAEEARIIFELNRAVEQASGPLRDSCRLMLLADEVRAGLRWSEAVGGRRCSLDPAGRLRIAGGRHPLLMEALGAAVCRGRGQAEPGKADCLAAGRDQVVPLDLEVPVDRQAVVISGPNAGGKSVALKTVGVFCLIAQSGWDVPAREDTILPLVDRVFADLGDDQSIAAALSSFSAHLRHLGEFLEQAGPGSLVLCDEIGSGTDPQEGTALAFAVLEELVARGARILASTHFGLLKAAVHDHPRMLNAAMDYDETDLRPLFTLRIGDPGTSHAFDIAEKMGFGPALLARARAMAGEEKVQVEQLLADLDRRARDLAASQQEVAREAARLRRQNEELEERLKGIGRERREVIEGSRRQADRLVREGRRAIEAAIREIKASRAEARVVKAARDRVEALAPPEPADAAPRGFLPVVGQRVRIPHLNLIGRVGEVRGDRIVAEAEGMRLTLTTAAVRPVEGDPAPSGSAPVGPSAPAVPTGGAAGWSWSDEAPAASPEIDVRGETGEDAWDRLDRLIDRAIPAGLETINVIHGFGTGRLRDHLHERLKADPRVAAFTESGPGQGGGGATKVRLADH
ncbi:MAG: Smr/MutS family protein [bacterium]